MKKRDKKKGTEKSEVSKGLENVVVAETKISFIDGDKGRLLYRGYNISDLAKYSNFEEVSYLLLFGKLPTNQELSSFKKELVERRVIPKDLQDVMFL